MPTTISFTEIATWKRCRMQYHWRYVKKLVPNRYAPHIELGTLCHKGLEAYLKGDNNIYGAIMAAIGPTEEMWEEDLEEATNRADLAANIVMRYVDDWPMDRYRSVAIEKEFDLPIPGTRNRVQGRIDAITQDHRGDLWLTEWKFPKTFRGEDDTALSTQLAIYQWAAIRIGYPVVGIRYNQILQRLPAVPEILKSGKTSRKEIYADWETYRRYLLERGEDPELYREEMEPKLAGKDFYRSYWIYRSPQQVEHYVQELRDISRDIATPKKRIYCCESSMTCGTCAYRDLCLEVARGRDPEHIIESSFQRNGQQHDADIGVETGSLPTTHGGDQA